MGFPLGRKGGPWVRAWVEVGHFIIKGVEELSWKGMHKTVVTIGGLAALCSPGAPWRFRVMALFFPKGLTVSDKFSDAAEIIQIF